MLMSLSEKMRKFMQGRYGADPFSLFLLIAGLVISFIAQLTSLLPLSILSYFIYAYSVFRILSKNIIARRKELGFFIKFISYPKRFITLKSKQFAERKIYKYFSCPICHQKLRAPKSRGKIQVTCQKCKNSFITKT